MGDNTAKINQLQRHFQGNNIDRDVLESVLLICDGDVNAAIQFLTAQEGQQAYNPNQVFISSLIEFFKIYFLIS